MSDDVPSTVLDLITNSGNSFHAKVARRLQNTGWHVIVSPYYLDQSQGKAREIDLIAEKSFAITDSLDQPNGYICMRLFVECKYISSPTVVWMANLDRESAVTAICSLSPFKPGNLYTERHHYLAPPRIVGKLFASGQGKGVESDPLYKGLNQSLNALVSMRARPVSIPAMVARSNTPKFVLEMPVIMCNSFDQFYSVPFFDDSDPKKMKRNFQLEVRYAYVDRRDRVRDDFFLIDVIDFEAFDRFTDALTVTAKAAAYLARQ